MFKEGEKLSYSLSLMYEEVPLCYGYGLCAAVFIRHSYGLRKSVTVELNLSAFHGTEPYSLTALQ